MNDESAAWADEVLVRPANLSPGSERNWIKKSWSESFCEADEAGPYPIDHAKRACCDSIEDWFTGTDGIMVLVAVSKSLDELLGFVVTYTTPRHGRCLMYVFVKRPCQTKVRERGPKIELLVKRGVASLLLEAAGFRPREAYAFCFRTQDMQRVLRHSKRWGNGFFRPKPAKYTSSNHYEKRAP